MSYRPSTLRSTTTQSANSLLSTPLHTPRWMPSRSPRPKPPVSPSWSLQGLERPVPPKTPSPRRANTAPPPIDVNKSLPASPRRPSSVYSSESGYTDIIDSYGNKNPRSPDGVEDEPLLPGRPVIQPLAYRQTISDLLNRRLGGDSFVSPPSIPSVPSLPLAYSVQHGSDMSTPISPPSGGGSWSNHGYDNVAPDETPLIVSSCSSPISPVPTSPIRDLSNLLAEPSPVQATPSSGFYNPFVQSPILREHPGRRHPRVVEMEQEAAAFVGLPGPISPRITDVIDPGLMPAPLSFIQRPSEAEQHSFSEEIRSSIDREQTPVSRFSPSSSEDGSNTFALGVRSSIRGYIQDKRKKRKAEAQKKREHERILSTASSKYPYMKPGLDEHRRSFSRRASLQNGMTNIYDKIRKFSLSGSSSGREEEPHDPRRRPKQRAISLSPYQKYGPAIWESPKRRGGEKRKIREGRQRAMLGLSPNSSRLEKRPTGGRTNRGSPATSSRTNKGKEIVQTFGKVKHKSTPSVVSDFHSGQKQLIHTFKLEDSRSSMMYGISHSHKRGPSKGSNSSSLMNVKRTTSEKRREELKKKIRVIGPADQFADGRVNYWI